MTCQPVERGVFFFVEFFLFQECLDSLWGLLDDEAVYDATGRFSKAVGIVEEMPYNCIQDWIMTFVT